MSIAIYASPATTTATERGRALGEAWRQQIHATWAKYQRFFAAHDLDERVSKEVGQRTLDAVAAWAPALAEEMAGAANGAALEPWQAGALNARSEVLARFRPATGGECSTAAYLPDGEPPRTIQTWDWHHEMPDVKLIWQYQAQPGRTVKTFTEFGILGKVGVTSTGLGLHFNLLQHETDGQSPGIPVHLVARRILDEADSVAEADEIIRSATLSASVALTVLTYRDGRSAGCTFELSPAGIGRIGVREDNFLLHTNHFLDPVLSRGERGGPLDPDTYARQKELERRIPALRSVDIADRAAALISHRAAAGALSSPLADGPSQHPADGAGLCCHPDPQAPLRSRWQTLLVIGIELGSGRLVFSDGNPCARGWWSTA